MVPHNIFFMVVQYYTSPAFQFSVWPFQATKIRLTVDSVSFDPLSATSIVALLILAPSAAALSATPMVVFVALSYPAPAASLHSSGQGVVTG